MRNKPTAQNVAPRVGLPISLALHVGIIAASLMSWSHQLDIADLSAPVVPVELVTVADKTDIAPTHTEEIKKPETPPETPPVVAPKPAPKTPVEVAPMPPNVKTMPRPTPPQKTTPQKAADFNIDNIVALLDKNKPKQQAWTGGKVGTQNVKGYGLQDARTADLRTALLSEIAKCWSPPVGAPHPEKLIVQYQLHLNRDGSIARAPELADTSLPPDNPYMRAAIEASRRAIYTCAPFKLPANRYTQWQDIIFVFDPRAMMAHSFGEQR
jgi:hypothetical protein